MKELLVTLRNTENIKLDFLRDGDWYEFRSVKIEENGDARSKSIRLTPKELSRIHAYLEGATL